MNDFENNAVVEEGSRSHYCLIETKAPKGKELLAQAEEFSLTTDQVEQKTYDKQWKKADGTVTKTEKVTYGHRTYKNASLTVGKHGGEVVNLDDTTPQLPLTGGAGVGILAAIGAAIIGAGAWFARRNSAES
ncbi:LPXTG cell wall anchor domain-containing protein [Corynebacterium diphtheriae bv. gravis]|nr:LPXTG cell wall anchor domain-containing protein [Corynebacterium diphtheriae bv. gravis]